MPLRRLGSAMLAVVAACLSLDTAALASSESGLIVFAGSSMTAVLPEIDPHNTYAFGSSTSLATQIAQGAPCDVFLSANTAAPASLYATGAVEKPINFIRNALTIVVPRSNPANIHSIYDLTKPGVRVDEASSSVPVGGYTLQVLNQMGLNAAIQPNVVSQETSDANVVEKVALGQVDAGFVYHSDYVLDPGHLTEIKVPAWAQPKITYALAIVTRSSNQQADQAFVARLLSKAGQAIFVKDGFLPVGAPVPTITVLKPAAAKAGAKVTLTGSNFAGITSVTFRGVPAQFRIISASRLMVVVPPTAMSGVVTVTNAAGNATSAKPFVVRKT